MMYVRPSFATQTFRDRDGRVIDYGNRWHGSPPDVVRGVRLRPVDASCAALTFIFHDRPGVHVHAGLLHDFAYPVCSCDACDSTWEHEANELERLVRAVVNGHYREAISFREGDPWLAFAFESPDGRSSGGFRAQGMSREEAQMALDALQSISGPWSAWPPASTVV
ncbi:DUF6226 family protein [Microbacterium sp. CCNWLW134]|uniref:DUF6226 family protein n=1 Tax=Microbacterium sp. CCNWLW134 TaxID=3122064 RepID=UPI00301058C9